jgi:uncharacterized protein
MVADHPNVELLRRGYAAYSSGDMETINEVFADDIVWHVAGRSELAGDYNGKDEVFGFFAKLMEVSEGTSRIEVHDVLANDEHGAVLITETATRAGREFSGRAVHTFHLEGGKVIEFWDAPLDQYATDDFLA